MNRLKETHVIYFSLIVILLNDVLKRIMKVALSIVGLGNDNSNLSHLLMELILLAIAVVLLRGTKQTHIFRCGTKGLIQGLWSGFIFFVFAVLACSSFVLKGMEQGLTFKSLPEIVAFIAFVISIGFAEEILFRGIIADCILERFGDSVLGIVKTVLLGGVIFGFAHVTNILSGQSVEETIVQMIATSMTGILLTAIYIRHKNIYAVAILHAVLDFLVMFRQAFFADNHITVVSVDIDFWASLRQSLISQSFFVIVAIFILRPAVMKRIVEERRK